MGSSRRQLLRSEGFKDDFEKTRWDVMPSLGLEEMAKVMTFGAKKYAAHNFRLGMNYSRLWNGAQRHLWAWLNGEDNDPESGISHLAHCACCVLMILDLQKLGKGDDDRWGSKQEHTSS